jgi:hypothetical protein
MGWELLSGLKALSSPSPPSKKKKKTEEEEKIRFAWVFC